MYIHKEQRAMRPETNSSDSTKIKQPKNEPNTHALPSAVTFYMSVQERRQLLRALKPLAQNRSQAILIAMGLIKNINEETKNKMGHAHG